MHDGRVFNNVTNGMHHVIVYTNDVCIDGVPMYHAGDVVDVVHNTKDVAWRVLTYLMKRDGVPMHIKG